jgi:hypothetical protein
VNQGLSMGLQLAASHFGAMHAVRKIELEVRLMRFYHRRPAAVASPDALARAGFSAAEINQAVKRGILRCGMTGCWLPAPPDPGFVQLVEGGRKRKRRAEGEDVEADDFDGADEPELTPAPPAPARRVPVWIPVAAGAVGVSALLVALVKSGVLTKKRPPVASINPGVPLLPDGPKEMGLEPDTRRLYQILRSRMAAKGVPLHTGSTIRDLAEQEKLVAEGKSAAPVSWHNVGRAVDAYPIDPSTGQPDLNGKRQDLFRLMHQEWAKLGGQGLAFLPYPDGPVRRITTSKGPVWDGGHLEYHGNFISATQALQAQQGYA